MKNIFKKRTGQDLGSKPVEDRSFARNRTMPSGSYREKENAEANESSRLSRHRMTLMRRRAGKLLIIVIFTTLILYIFMANFVTRASIRIDGSKLARAANTSLYEKVVENYISKYPLTRIKFLMDQDNLLTHIQTSNPEVLSVVRSSQNIIGQTSFTIEFRKPIASWVIDGKQSYVDDNGVVFQNNYFKEPIIKVEDEAGGQLDMSSVSISNRFLGFIGRVVAAYSATEHSVNKIVIPKDKVRQINVSLNELGYYVKLSADRPAGEQVEDSIVAIGHLKSKGLVPTYIDVRVSRRTAWF